MPTCDSCGKPLVGRQRRWCSDRCRKAAAASDLVILARQLTRAIDQFIALTDSQDRTSLSELEVTQLSETG